LRHEDAAPGAGGGQGLALINPTAPRVYPKAELENETTFDDDTRGQAASDPQGEARGLTPRFSLFRRAFLFSRPTNLKPEKPLLDRHIPRTGQTRLPMARPTRPRPKSPISAPPEVSRPPTRLPHGPEIFAGGRPCPPLSRFAPRPQARSHRVCCREPIIRGLPARKC